MRLVLTFEQRQKSRLRARTESAVATTDSMKVSMSRTIGKASSFPDSWRIGIGPTSII